MKPANVFEVVFSLPFAVSSNTSVKVLRTALNYTKPSVQTRMQTIAEDNSEEKGALGSVAHTSMQTSCARGSMSAPVDSNAEDNSASDRC
jgi:hypothetical protein